MVINEYKQILDAGHFETDEQMEQMEFMINTIRQYEPGYETSYQKRKNIVDAERKMAELIENDEKMHQLQKAARDASGYNQARPGQMIIDPNLHTIVTINDKQFMLINKNTDQKTYTFKALDNTETKRCKFDTQGNWTEIIDRNGNESDVSIVFLAHREPQQQGKKGGRCHTKKRQRKYTKTKRLNVKTKPKRCKTVTKC